MLGLGRWRRHPHVTQRMGMLHILCNANRYGVMSLAGDAPGRATWFTAAAQNPLLTSPT